MAYNRVAIAFGFTTIRIDKIIKNPTRDHFACQKIKRKNLDMIISTNIGRNTILIVRSHVIQI